MFRREDLFLLSGVEAEDSAFVGAVLSDLCCGTLSVGAGFIGVALGVFALSHLYGGAVLSGCSGYRYLQKQPSDEHKANPLRCELLSNLSISFASADNLLTQDDAREITRMSEKEVKRK